MRSLFIQVNIVSLVHACKIKTSRGSVLTSSHSKTKSKADLDFCVLTPLNYDGQVA